jgi:hypothetical protein
MRFGLNAVTLDFRVNRRKVDALFANCRRRRLGLGRFAGDRRIATCRFECLAKIARLKGWTGTFDDCPSTVSCHVQGQTKTGKARGVALSGQEFVSAN